MVSVPAGVVVGVAAAVANNIGFAAEGGLGGCIVDMESLGSSAGTAGTAHSDIGPGSSGTVRSDTGPGTSDIVRSGIGSDTCSGNYPGRRWMVYTAQTYSIAVVVLLNLMVDPGPAQAERNSAACTLPAGVSIGPSLVERADPPSPSPMEYKLEAAPVRPLPGLEGFSSF
jgi:hypothetical protein